MFDITIVIDFASIAVGLNEIVKVVENPAWIGVFVEFWSIVNKDILLPFLMILLGLPVRFKSAAPKFSIVKITSTLDVPT